MLGQIVFMEMGARDDAGPGMAHWAGRGILRCPVGSVASEHMHSFVSFGHSNEMMLAFATGQKDVTAEVVAHDMGSTMTRPIWPMPRKGSGQAGGGMLARSAAIPSPEGTETMLIAILLRAPATAIADRRMYALRGDISVDGRMMVLNDPKRCPVAERNGEGINQIYHEPIWGWDVEPFGIRALMDRRTNAMCEEYLTLDLVPDRTPEQEARYEAMRHSEARWVVNHHDETYQKYRTRLFDRCGRPPFEGIETAAQIEERERQSTEVAREIIREEDEVEGYTPRFPLGQAA